MALNSNEQLKEALARCNAPVICVPNGRVDAAASAFVLARILRRLGKEPVIACTDGRLPKALQPFADGEAMCAGLPELARCVVEIDAGKTKVKELSYEMHGDTLKVFLTPKAGGWSEKDVRVTSSGYRFDLVIAVGAPDLEALGALYRDNAGFFLAVPIVNIDNAPENERYGAVNAVDLSASSCAEIILGLAEAIDPSVVDGHAATALFAGILSATKSFSGRGVKPKTLHAAATLLGKGADHAGLVEILHRTRSVAALRLWGRALVRLEARPEIGLVWTALAKEDFLRAGAGADDLGGVVEELIASSPEARVICLLFETDGAIEGILHASAPHDARSIGKELGADGTAENARFRFEDTTLSDAQTRAVRALASAMSER